MSANADNTLPLQQAPVSTSLDDAPVVENKVKVTEELRGTALANGWKVRSTNSVVLQAVCPNIVSFASLSVYHEATKSISKSHRVIIETMISTIGKELVVSTRIGSKRKREETTASGVCHDELRDKIRETIGKLSKATGSPPQRDLDKATSVLDAVVCLLKAVGGEEERATQSYGIFFKKLAISDPRNRIVLAFRLHAGTPVRIQDLKQCLGDCWADGAITCADTVNGVDSVSLPLTEEGTISLEHGNAPVMVVTSICPSSSSA